MTPHHRTAIGAVTLSVAAALLTACASPPGSSAPAAAAAPPRDTAAACAAQVKLDSNIPPGADPDSPPPPAQEMQAWADSVAPDFALVSQNAPDSLADSLDVLSAQLDQAKQGMRLDVTDPAGSAASRAVGRWVHDTCGFQTLDVVNDGGRFGTTPATLKPGPVAIEFTNTGDPSRAGFVLLLGRVKDGQDPTLEDLNTGQADVEQVTDIVTAAQPADDAAGYTSATLTSGRYILLSPLGMPPDFTGGIVSAELSVP